MSSMPIEGVLPSPAAPENYGQHSRCRRSEQEKTSGYYDDFQLERTEVEYLPHVEEPAAEPRWEAESVLTDTPARAQKE